MATDVFDVRGLPTMFVLSSVVEGVIQSTHELGVDVRITVAKGGDAVSSATGRFQREDERERLRLAEDE